MRSRKGPGALQSQEGVGAASAEGSRALPLPEGKGASYGQGGEGAAKAAKLKGSCIPGPRGGLSGNQCRRVTEATAPQASSKLGVKAS